MVDRAGGVSTAARTRRSARVLHAAFAALATAVVASGLVSTAGGTAYAVSPDVVISQVYGGGGNAGAQYHNDFIELYNRGAATVSIAGWTVQYASASGSTWSKTALSGSITPGRYFLIAEAPGSGGGASLPAPDATGSIAMNATSAKVALVTGTTALTCATGCDKAAGVKDFVGYGSSASSSEAAPTGNLSNTTAALRDNGGATDTDNNSADFTVGAPTPRNSGFGGAARVHDIQGTSHLSPRNGTQVTGVPAVVTAKTTNGFWMQDPQPDADPATSEGIFVFTGTTPTVAVGDSVTVSGTASEFRPGGTSGTNNLTTTEISNPTITTVARGVPLPPPTLVGTRGRVPPSTVIEDDASGDVETSGVFDPANDGIDFWESMESMRVEIDNAAVVGPRSTFGEIPVVPAGSTTRTNRGGILLQAGDANPERVLLDDVLTATPTANVGDTLTGPVIGVLSYSFGDFTLLSTTTAVVSSGGITPESTAAASAGQLSVATFNVENLDPTDPQSKFDGLAAQIVNRLRSPDLLALEEVQDNSGATDNGTVDCDRTMNALIDAVAAAGGPGYTFRQISPQNDADGGEPGGNIRQVFMYRTDRGLSFVDRAGATATTANAVLSTGGVVSLRYSPGRVDPANSAFTDSRKPLAAEFTFNGRTVFAIANHFNSKGGDQPLFGHFQPPSRPSETQRHNQAAVVKDFVDRILAVDSSAAVVVLGDLNDFEFSRTADILTANSALLDLPRTLPLAERYTFVFEGNSQVLDHILLSPNLAAKAYSYDVVHVNAEFASQLSDHDPQVVRIPLP